MAVSRNHEELKIFLFGKTGSGKSSTGNTILGECCFMTSSGLQQCTSEYQKETRKIGSIMVEVVDTPGIPSASDVVGYQQLVEKLIALTHPGPHALLFVVRLDSRISAEEFRDFKRVTTFLGEKTNEYLITVFTHGDRLRRAGKKFSELLQTAPPQLVDILEECSDRYVVFDNTAEDPTRQVEELMNKAKALKRRNRGPLTLPYIGLQPKELRGQIERELRNVLQREQQLLASQISREEEILKYQKISEEIHKMDNRIAELEGELKMRKEQKHVTTQRAAGLRRKFDEEQKNAKTRRERAVQIATENEFTLDEKVRIGFLHQDVCG